jgi:cysteine desulfuration protein SufE
MQTALRLSTSQQQEPIDAIRADLADLDDWEDRYRYIIELGRMLPPFPDALRTETNKVRGCTSQVWITSSLERPEADSPAVLEFRGDSDAHIVRGLVAILLALYQGKTPDDILQIDAKSVFAEFGLKDHLSPQRSNGFYAMVERICRDARASSAPG